MKIDDYVKTNTKCRCEKRKFTVSRLMYPTLEDFMKEMDQGAHNMSSNMRCTGRTEAHCLSIIVCAMHNVGSPTIITIDNHSPQTRAYKRYTLDNIMYLISKLGFEHFTCDKTRFTITYDPMVTYEAVYTYVEVPK